MDEQENRRLWLIKELLRERKAEREIEIPRETAAQKALLRALLNLRPPMSAAESFLQVQDDYLREELRRRGVIDYRDLTPVLPGLYLWQGDITTLRCGAIVNAANSQMLGCFHPNHGCIDNAIHTFAGVQLRLECAALMKRQGHAEPAGEAKITGAYNLPCRHVIHTVGPVVGGTVTEADKKQLSACYRSCLELAAENRVESVAFCCISTGEFHFPNRRAAEIAVETVRGFQRQTNGKIEVIFNVFKDTDLQIYRELLGKAQAGD